MGSSTLSSQPSSPIATWPSIQQASELLRVMILAAQRAEDLRGSAK